MRTAGTPTLTVASRKQRTIYCLPVCLAVALLLASNAKADLLPNGPGKATTVRVCGRCHSPERAASLHQKRSAWEETMIKMVKLGASGTDEELEAVLTYLSTNFGPETPGPININKASAVDLEAGLLLRRSQAKEIINFRSEHGDFKSIDDLRRVPGIDFAQIQSKKYRLEF